MNDVKLLACVDIDNTDRHDCVMVLTQTPEWKCPMVFVQWIQILADGLATCKGIVRVDGVSILYANKCVGQGAPPVNSLNLTLQLSL